MDIVFKPDNKSIFNFRVAGIWIEDGHVLIHKSINDTHWALPGGRAKMGEDSESSIKRELLEELGVHVSVDRLVWSVESFFMYNDLDYHEIGLYYLVSTPDSFYQKDLFNGLEGDQLLYKWVPIHELNEISLEPAFLKSGIQDMPNRVEHVILKK